MERCGPDCLPRIAQFQKKTTKFMKKKTYVMTLKLQKGLIDLA